MVGDVKIRCDTGTFFIVCQFLGNDSMVPGSSGTVFSIFKSALPASLDAPYLWLHHLSAFLNEWHCKY